MRIVRRGKESLLLFAHGSNEIYWAVIPLLLPLIRKEFFFNYAQAGLVLTCFFAVISVFSLISGHLGDIYKAGKVLAFGFLFSGVVFSFLSLISSYLQVVVVLAFTSIGVSVFHPIGTALISRSWQRGISLGFFEAVGLLGAVVTTLLFGLMVSFLGWRLTCIVLAIPSLLVGLIFLTSHNEFKYETSKVYAEDKNNTSFELKSIVLFYFARGAQIFGGVAIMSFMPLFAVDVRGLLPENASLFPFFIWAGGVPGSLVCGALSDYFSALKVIFALMLVIVPIILVITLPVSVPSFMTFIFLTVLGFCHLGAWASQTVWLSQISYRKTQGKIFGGIVALAGLTRVFSPFVFGFLGDKGGLTFTLQCATIPIIIGTLCLGSLIKKTG